MDTEDGIMVGTGSKNKRGLCRQDSDGEESESALRALPFGGGLVGGLGMGKKGGWEGSVSVTR